MLQGHWDVLRWISALGGRGATPPPNSARDVPPSFPLQEKRGRVNDLLRPLAQPSTTGPTGSISAEVQLAKVREAHQKALATTMALEEEIEWLNWSITWDCHIAHTPSQSQDWHKRRSQGWSRWSCKALPEGSLAHSPAYSPPWWEGEEAELDLGPSPELGPSVERFFHSPAGEEDEEGHFPAEPPVGEHEKWIEWRGQEVDTLNWWQELEMVREVDDIQKLGWKIQASFELPWWMSVKHAIQNYYLAPPAPYCICQKDFLLLPDLRFHWLDLWEAQQEKTMAHAQALQCCAERANLPTLGQPSLLVGSVLELQKMMEQYISFSDDIILDGVALLEGYFGSQTSVSTDALPAPSNVPSEEVATPVSWPLKESMLLWVPHEKWVKVEAPPNQFLGWEKVQHPSQPVATVGQAPQACCDMKQKHWHQSSKVRKVWCQRAEEQMQVRITKRDSPSSEPLEPTHIVAPLLGFERVMACLRGDPLPVTALEVPLGFTQPEVATRPAVATMCASHVIQDEGSGVTHMETIIPLFGG